MSFEAPHVGFVLVSYGLSFFVMAVLVALHIIRARRVSGRLSELEAAGAPRRKPAGQS